MRKYIYYTPGVLLLVLFLFFGFKLGFAQILPAWWLVDGLLFISAIIMSKDKYWGCIPGLILGGYCLYLSTQETGQVINIERPIGIFLILVYLFFGVYILRKQTKEKRKNH